MKPKDDRTNPFDVEAVRTAVWVADGVIDDDGVSWLSVLVWKIVDTPPVWVSVTGRTVTTGLVVGVDVKEEADGWLDDGQFLVAINKRSIYLVLSWLEEDEEKEEEESKVFVEEAMIDNADSTVTEDVVEVWSVDDSVVADESNKDVEVEMGTEVEEVVRDDVVNELSDWVENAWLDVSDTLVVGVVTTVELLELLGDSEDSTDNDVDVSAGADVDVKGVDDAKSAPEDWESLPLGGAWGSRFLKAEEGLACTETVKDRTIRKASKKRVKMRPAQDDGWGIAWRVMREGFTRLLQPSSSLSFKTIWGEPEDNGADKNIIRLPTFGS
jgi:hypothetical protein